MIQSPAIQYLEKLGIPFRVFTHTAPIATIEQAAAERNQTVDQIIRSILFRYESNQFVMVLINGENQVSWLSLRQHLKTNRTAMATVQEVMTITGYSPGAVTPFGLITPIPILSDENVFQVSEISIGSGIRGSTIILLSKDLLRACPQIEILKLS